MTVLVVSHSTTFLDDICTNIIHYENQKLVTYHGNLSNFVRQRPEAKHYYELSTDSLVFNFPVPGRLDGVTSRTQAIIKMEDVTFTYPGASKPQLRNVTLRVSSSSSGGDRLFMPVHRSDDQEVCLLCAASCLE